MCINGYWVSIDAMTHSYVWHWLIHTCDIDSFICVTLTHSYVWHWYWVSIDAITHSYVWHDSYVETMTHPYVCGMTAWHDYRDVESSPCVVCLDGHCDSFICVTWLLHMYDAWHDYRDGESSPCVLSLSGHHDSLNFVTWLVYLHHAVTGTARVHNVC